MLGKTLEHEQIYCSALQGWISTSANMVARLTLLSLVPGSTAHAQPPPSFRCQQVL